MERRIVFSGSSLEIARGLRLFGEGGTLTSLLFVLADEYEAESEDDENLKAIGEEERANSELVSRRLVRLESRQVHRGFNREVRARSNISVKNPVTICTL